MGDDGGDGLVDLMGDRGGQRNQRRDAHQAEDCSGSGISDICRNLSDLYAFTRSFAIIPIVPHDRAARAAGLVGLTQFRG